MPSKRLFIFDPARHLNTRFSEISDNFDLFFIPSYMLELVYAGAPFHLAINTWSMQEMTEAQVDHYCAMLHYCLDGFFYSCNIPCHVHNYDLKSRLSDVYRLYFRVLPGEDPVSALAWGDITHVCNSSKRPHALTVKEAVLRNNFSVDQTLQVS